MKQYQFTLTADQIQLIGMALGQMPHDKVRPLIDQLQQQINVQDQPHAPEPAPEPAPKRAEAVNAV